MHTPDQNLESATAGTLAGAIVRLVAGYDPEKRTFSRTSRSFQINDKIDGLSWMHAARSNAKELLHTLATNMPEAAIEAFGRDGAELLRSDGVIGVVDSFDGFDEVPPGTEWLISGWHHLTSRPDIQQKIADWYWYDIVHGPISWMQNNGLTSRRTLAAAVRARNTSGTQLQALKDSVSQYGETDGVTRFLQGYKGGEYIPVIDGWPEFQGSVGRWPESSDLGWSSLETAPAAVMDAASRLAREPLAKTAVYIVAGALGALFLGAVLKLGSG
jgi:hypothetical protein